MIQLNSTGQGGVAAVRGGKAPPVGLVGLHNGVIWQHIALVVDPLQLTIREGDGDAVQCQGGVLYVRLTAPPPPAPPQGGGESRTLSRKFWEKQLCD